MDMNALSTLLQRTLDPAAGQAAEAELKQARKIIGFCPGILQVKKCSNTSNDKKYS